jgi:hypothetical protein
MITNVQNKYLITIMPDSYNDQKVKMICKLQKMPVNFIIRNSIFGIRYFTPHLILSGLLDETPSHSLRSQYKLYRYQSYWLVLLLST